MPDFIKIDNLAKVLQAINDLAGKDVLVGIPDSAPEREPDDDGGMPPPSNAVIGYMQETGMPEHNLPARPFLVPGVASVQGKVAVRLGKAASAALDGDKSGAETHMGRAGLEAQNAVRARINSGIGPALSEATLRQRARRGRKGAILELERRAGGMEPSTEYAKPLIDTGQLRNSITYVIRKKK
ncbi:hypothetical protein [Herbaspirillum huttiense]|uniref:hypothetical protein n=1 Tax=Herbaspirillum huttiense TaxID=863372 RepID=UPI001AC77510|nr:hypothetical protein [Herbaspirillum huttiense]MBN9359825.1 hypothetical protein [Herbaspirillum huttiense]